MNTIVYLLAICVSCSYAILYTDIKCKQYPLPKHGIILCRHSKYTGDSCNVVCDEGYDVEYLQAEQYICGLNGIWHVKPDVLKMPWPDCVAIDRSGGPIP